jgi:hypothetical protein
VTVFHQAPACGEVTKFKIDIHFPPIWYETEQTEKK